MLRVKFNIEQIENLEQLFAHLKTCQNGSKSGIKLQRYISKLSEGDSEAKAENGDDEKWKNIQQEIIDNGY